MLYHESERISYNSQTILEFYGKFEKELFEKSMLKLVEETPVLRSFIKDGRIRPQRYIYSECPFKIEQLVEYSSNSDQSVIDEFCMRPFNLEKGPIIRALVIHLSSDHHKLVLNIHHTLGDGFAQMVLLEDLLALMSGKDIDRKVRQVPPFLWRKALYQLKGAKWFLGRLITYFRPFRKERSYKMATLVTNHEVTKRKVKSRTIKISAEFEGLFNLLRREQSLSHIELLTFITMRSKGNYFSYNSIGSLSPDDSRQER